jgi:hypothetical protein
MNNSTAVPLTRSNYILATGEKASERLRLLNEIFGPGTRELLRLAGLERPRPNVIECKIM